MRVWRPRGLTRPAQALPVPYASSATWRIPSTPIEAYRPLLRVPLTDGVGQAIVSGSGSATVTIGPQGLGTRWYPVKVDISTTSGANDASTMQLFLGTTPPGIPQTGWNSLGPLQQGALILLLMGGIMAGAVLTGLLARKLAEGSSSS